MKRHAPFLVALALFGCHVSQTAGPGLDRQAAAVQRRAIVVDTHVDTTSRLLDEGFDLEARATTGHLDLPRMREGGLGAPFFSIYVAAEWVGRGASRRALDMIDTVYEQCDRHPSEIALAVSVADAERLHREGRVAAFMGIEGGHAIENSLRTLREFHRLGVRYMTLTHVNTNDWADSSTDDARWGGLNAFGREVVREMNRLGMMVDVSHVSDDCIRDVLETSEAPIIASHSSCRAISNIPRNLPDDLIRAIAAKGGVVQLNFGTLFLSQAAAGVAWPAIEKINALRKSAGSNPVTANEEIERMRKSIPTVHVPAEALIDHIDHVVKLVGADHVGLGSDFDGVPSVPDGLEDCSKLPWITKRLLEKGYSEDDVIKILGGNLLRVLGECERVAARLQRERPPSTATIEKLVPDLHH
ncbi:MAG: membrane dipeptidase [Planctomycetes bacterium]|nr:membrane dipeptidase [Planctomycetota bacterium]